MQNQKPKLTPKALIFGSASAIFITNFLFLYLFRNQLGHVSSAYQLLDAFFGILTVAGFATLITGLVRYFRHTQPSAKQQQRARRNKLKAVIIFVVVVSLAVTASATIQFFVTKNIQSHSAYTNGTVTKLYTTSITNKKKVAYTYWVQYTFSPTSNRTIYHETYGLNQVQYNSLHVGGSVSVYYDTQKPNVQNVAGYQQDPSSLEEVALVSVAILLLSLVSFVVI